MSMVTHSIAPKRAFRVDCSLGRAPCQSSATVTGEHKRGVSSLLSWLQRAIKASSRALQTSIRMSESTKTEIKNRFSAGAFLCEAYVDKLRYRANLGDSSEDQRAPPWLLCGRRANCHIFRERLDAPTPRSMYPAAASE